MCEALSVYNVLTGIELTGECYAALVVLEVEIV